MEVSNMEKHTCLICGEEFESGKTNVYTCDKCESKIRMAKKIEMVDKAQKLLEKRTGKMRSFKPKLDMSEYAKAVKQRVVDGIDNFGSIPETAAGIQMQRIELKYETQKDIAGRKVDFIIPEIKIILEVDGELYHTDENKAFLRDRQIMRAVGEKWEIVHIKAQQIPKYTWNLREALPHVVIQRNYQIGFRNSTCNWYLLEEFRDLEFYLKRSKENENPRLPKTNRAT